MGGYLWRANACLLWLLFLLPAGAGSVTLAWDPVDVATGYKVYWGVQSRVYPNSKDVGNQTTATVDHLINTFTYYFAVTAYNEAGESDYSSEVSIRIPDLPAPTVPQMLGPDFSWSYVGSDTLQGFIVYWQEVGVKRIWSKMIPDPSAWFCPLTGLTPNTDYQVWCAAYTSYRPVGKTIPIYLMSEPSDRVKYRTPVSAAEGITVDFMTDGQVRVQVFTNQRPVLQWSSDLRGWSDMAPLAKVGPGQYQIFDPEAAIRFYRVK